MLRMYTIHPGHGHVQGPQEIRTRYWNAYMLFYVEVDNSGNRGAGSTQAVGSEGAGGGPAPLSPMPELGDKLAQLQVSKACDTDILVT